MFGYYEQTGQCLREVLQKISSSLKIKNMRVKLAELCYLFYL